MANTIIISDVLKIKNRIINLANKVVNQHEKAFLDLVENKKELTDEILETENFINKESVDIKNEISFLLTKEPLAKYLRRAVSYLIISKELERIADYAKQIVLFTKRVQNPSGSSIRRIKDIYECVINMLKSLSHNIEIEKTEEVLKLANSDDLVDTKCVEVNKEFIASFSQKKYNEEEVHERLYILSLINNLERAGDHIVNICESLYYIINGTYVKL